ncbi:MAG: serine/threonine protein kinase [Rhodocyclales bacterium]|nr:serine/threonine protein kinase [Rhodocyclales bacterium]
MSKRPPDAAPYADLTPDRMLDAIESVGLRCDGRLLALNSFENRVFQIWLDDAPPVVAKFYRPHRWSDAAIQEEHDFTRELAAREVPAVPPLVIDGRTLHKHGAYRFAVFKKQGGRAPEFDRPDVLEWMGRFLGRIHAVGATTPFRARPALDIASFGEEPRDFLLDGGFVPEELEIAWASVVDQALDGVYDCFERAGDVASLRLHGDCHQGNVLWTEQGPHFVDFDDARSGPAIQDFWMLLSGDEAAMGVQLGQLLRGYEQFRAFDERELNLIEALRTLRLIHYSAWIARRWQDPAFPAAFPWFGTARYWQDRILELREQIPLMNEAPIRPV